MLNIEILISIFTKLANEYTKDGNEFDEDEIIDDISGVLKFVGTEIDQRTKRKIIRGYHERHQG